MRALEEVLCVLEMSNIYLECPQPRQKSRLLGIKEKLPLPGVPEEANQSHVWEVSAVKANRAPSAARGHLPANHLDFLRINASMEGASEGWEW